MFSEYDTNVHLACVTEGILPQSRQNKLKRPRRQQRRKPKIVVIGKMTKTGNVHKSKVEGIWKKKTSKKTLPTKGNEWPWMDIDEKVLM